MNHLFFFKYDFMFIYIFFSKQKPISTMERIILLSFNSTDNDGLWIAIFMQQVWLQWNSAQSPHSSLGCVEAVQSLSSSLRDGGKFRESS